MASRVYHTSRINSDAIRAIFERALADATRMMTNDDVVAVKVHFGE